MRKDLDDDVLSERMRHGDRGAFATLTTRYWVAVHRIAWNMLPDQSKAREVAEETFLRALRSPGWFPRDAPFKVSLYRLAIVLSLVRHQPSTAFRAESFLPQFDASGRLVVPEGDWSELAGRRDLAEQIRKGLDHVKGLDRAAFVLRAMEQVPLEEAAAILRTSAERIRDRAHRTCLLLTGFLGRLVGAAEGETRWRTPSASCSSRTKGSVSLHSPRTEIGLIEGKEVFGACGNCCRQLIDVKRAAPHHGDEFHRRRSANGTWVRPS
jgi:RNA polymerase sigma-70 factor (ECF subfamily)